ncbi:hypothetical protein D1872_81760 [compost metagenome]
MYHVVYGVGRGRAARPFEDKVRAFKFAKKVQGQVKLKVGYRYYIIREEKQA